MKRIAALLSLLCALMPIWGQDVDSDAAEYGFQMLKINTSLPSAGSGGTCALNSNDALAFLSNPIAGLYNRNRGLSVNSQSWLFDTRMTTIGVSSSSGRHSGGVAFRNLDYGSFETRDEQGDYLGDYHPLDLSLVANYAYRLLPDVFLGVNLGGLYEEISSASAYGITSDIGTAWQSPVTGMTISGAVKYLGKTSKMNSKSIKLPATCELGITQEYSSSGIDLTGEMKFLKPIDDDQLQMAIGAQADYHRLLSLRCGWKINYDAEAFSAGLGVHVKRLDIDYAYLPFQNDLDEVHMIGLTYHY